MSAQIDALDINILLILLGAALVLMSSLALVLVMIFQPKRRAEVLRWLAKRFTF